MSGSRGCPWYCKFCSISAFYRTPNGKIWRARSPHNIIKEIENLIKQTGIRKFNFIDDQFMGSGEIGRTRALELANEIISRGLNIKFMIQTRSDSVQEDIFSNLAKAGLFRVFLGVESGYQPTLDYFCKQCRIESNVKAIDILKRLGIKISMGFIMFHEYSTLEEIEANLDFLETIINIGYTDYNIETFFNDLQIQPGTALFEEKSQWCFDSNYNGIYEIKDELARAYRKNLQGTLRPLTRPYEEIQIFRDRELFKEDILEIFERNMSLLAFNMARNYLSYFKKRGEVPADVLCQKEKDIYRESVKLSATLSAIRNLNVDTDTVANAISNKLPS